MDCRAPDSGGTVKTYLVLLCVAILLAAAPGFAEKKMIFTLNDPRGDDHGDGTLILPTQGDIRPGDLDLVSLSAREEDDGTLFEASFSNVIQDPGVRAIDAGGRQLKQVARYGFYTFNIDIYIDMDRKPGSGFTRTLPGRNALIAPDNAWEKVICLTPQPQGTTALFRKYLQRYAEDKLRDVKGRVDPEDTKGIKADTATDLEGYYFFPTQIRVFSKKITFFVPDSFLRGKAQANWSYVVVVTASSYEENIDFADFGTSRTEPGLANLSVGEGGWSDRLGTSRKEVQLLPPIVDMIVPAGLKQEDVLRNFDVNEDRPVVLPGVVPGP